MLLEQAWLLRKQQLSSKKMLTLEWSESRGGDNFLKHKLSRLMCSRGSNNNKPNWWKRIQKKTQIQFLCPWSNQILNLLVTANNNKRSESVCVMEVWLVVLAKNAARRWTHTERIWHDRSQIDSDACATELTVQLHRGSQLDPRVDRGEEDGGDSNYDWTASN